MTGSPHRAQPIDALREFFLVVAEGTASASARAAEAFAQTLAKLDPGDLPPNALPHWQAMARLLKCSATQPVPARAVNAVRAWPAARIDALLGHLQGLRAVLERVENERLEDEIRDNIRHAYL